MKTTDCGCEVFDGEIIIEFDGKKLCQDCFEREITRLFSIGAYRTLADLVGSEYWEVG